MAKILFTIFILSVSFQISFGQENPKAVLIDEFGDINCEFLLAKLDYFYVTLQNNPAATGYVVISEKKEDNRRSFRYRSWIHGNTNFRRFDLNRLTIIRDNTAENLKIQFWLVPLGADAPNSSNLGWDSSFPVSKPEMFYSENDAYICPGEELLRFSEILTEQTELRAHFVINTESIKAFNERKKELSNEFKEVPANRLRFFYVRNRINSYVEYWLVPPKKK